MNCFVDHSVRSKIKLERWFKTYDSNGPSISRLMKYSKAEVGKLFSTKGQTVNISDLWTMPFLS